MYTGPAELLNRANGETLLHGEAELTVDRSRPGRAWSGTFKIDDADPAAVFEPLGDHYAVRLLDDSEVVDAAVRHQDPDDRSVLHLTGAESG